LRKVSSQRVDGLDRSGLSGVGGLNHITGAGVRAGVTRQCFGIGVDLQATAIAAVAGDTFGH